MRIEIKNDKEVKASQDGTNKIQLFYNPLVIDKKQQQFFFYIIVVAGFIDQLGQHF